MHQKQGYDFFSVLPASNTQQAASVRSNLKFSRLIPSCHNMAFTVCRIKHLFTLLQLSCGRHSIKYVSVGLSKLNSLDSPIVLALPSLHSPSDGLALSICLIRY